jgi:adenylate kinase family enzyme
MGRLNAAVVGFAGRKKSGKTTISQAVAEALGWQHASFGDYVRYVASQRGLDATSIPVLQDLGQVLIEEGWTQFCTGLLIHAKWAPGNGLIVDGIRHAEAAQHLTSLVAPLRFILVYVSTDDDVLDARRGTGSAIDYETLERHSTEAQVKTRLNSVAALTVDGASPLHQLVGDVVSFIGGGSKPS